MMCTNVFSLCMCIDNIGDPSCSNKICKILCVSVHAYIYIYICMCLSNSLPIPKAVVHRLSSSQQPSLRTCPIYNLILLSLCWLMVKLITNPQHIQRAIDSFVYALFIKFFIHQTFTLCCNSHYV